MKRDIIPSEFELARERTQQLLCFWDTKHGVETSQQNTCVSTESKASLHQSNEPNSNLDRAEDDVELIIPSLSALSRDFFSMPQSKIDEGPGRLTGPGKNSSHRGVEAYISASSISNTSNLEESIRRIEKKESSMAASEKSSGNNKAQNTANISNAFADTESNLITSLTSILLDGVQDNIVTTTSNPSPPYSKSSSVALNAILTKFSKTPRRVCQHPFRKNDIVWVCRTCQSDETCVLCHECFTRSNHEGHDVAFYHAQAGGCCDCGDPDAWDPCGFCDLHGHNSDSAKPLLGKDIEDRAKGMVRAIGDWLVEELVDNVEKGWDRINVLSKQGNLSQDEKTNLLQDIGIKGCVDEGLYLVFHSDDIHSMSETSSTLSRLLNIPPSTMTKIHRLFKSNNGNLILWGTCELVAELGPQTAFLWKEKEPKACQQVSSLILEKALIFKERGFNTSVQTRREIQIEQKAIAVLHWLSIVARSCDILCEVVAHSIGEKHLSPLLNTDLKLPRKLTESWHALLLTLLAIPKFKADLAAAYCDSYGKITNEYANGVGVLDCSCFTLSVQFLNREKYVKELVKRKGLLEQLTKALLDTLSLAAEKYQRGNMVSSKRTMNTLELNTMVARGHDNTNERGSTNRNNLLDFSTPPWSPRQLASGEINEQAHDSDSSSPSLTLNPLHPVLSNRRYSPCISDLKCVLNVVGMARQFCKYECFEDWLELLSIAQGMDWQVWRTWSLGHVETEPKGWVGAFNASISLGSLFERILIWEEEESPAVTKNFFMRPKSLCLECPTNDTNATLSSEIAGVTVRTLVYIAKWQAKHFLQYTCDENIEHSQLILPYATISAKRGTNLAFLALPFTQTHPWSFHYPLYRFAASCIRECIRRGEEDKGGGVSAVISLLRSSEELSTLSKASPQCGKYNITAQSVDDNAEFISLLRGLCEIPLIILSRAAQIRAGLWKRNGAAMHDQVLNYQEPPFCRALRDSDLNLLQFSIFGLMELNEPLSYFTNLSAHRFGVFDFCGLTSGPMSDQNGYKEEIKSGLYPVLNSDAMEIGDTDGAYELPAIYKPASEDPVATLTLLEELLHLWIILLTELPPQPTSNSHSESIAQAKNRLRREVIHRLASGPKTHSELAEVSYVLPQPDNSALNEEGRILNPDDASGAALESILGIVATQHHSRNYGPNRWELKKEAWADYDPAFWHIPQRHHQTAAEMRPKVDLNAEGVPYAPKWGKCHKLFEQLRFTFTSDSVLLSVCYRVLHTHCCVKLKSKDGSSAIDSDGKHDQLQGAMAYERDALSETALSRAVHLLTLGAFAWKEAQRNVKSESFGDFKGCIFTKGDNLTTEEWIKKSLLENPEIIMDSTWYSGEDCLLLLLQRLTVEGGGREGGFVAQDPALRSGAKYLCEFASSHSEDARKLLSLDGEKDKQRKERNAEQRKKEAKEARMRAMKKMSLMTTKFLDGLKEEEEDEKNSIGSSISASASTYPNTDATSDCDTSKLKQKDDLDFSDSSGIDSLSGNSMNVCQSSCSMQASCFTTTRRNISLLKERPQCIICVDDNTATQFPEGHMSEDDDTSTAAALEHHSSNKVSSHRKNNALAFCGFAQASTVLKGGGGPLGDSVTRFVGTHVALCGHAVHTSCCDSYLASVAQRESLTGIGDRLEGGKKGEFRCPLCQRLSNCLVPFIDVGLDWIDTPSDGKEESKDMEIDDNVNISKTTSLQTFLSTSKWAINKSPSPSRSTSSLSNSSFPHKSRRIFSKKDLFAAWNNVMRPRFRRKSSSSSSSNFFPVKSSKQKLKSTSSTKDTSSGATEVWRRLMDQLSDVSHRADWKRLGENDLSRDYGEFRHYLVEKVAYNTHIRMDGSGNNIIEWPSCIVYPSSITDTRKNELSREKLISKLLLSIQAFTYSICSEASDVRRRSGDPSTKNKFGIQSVSPDGFLIQMPSIDSGEQAFDGRLGKLRYLGLAVIAATGAVAREIVPLVLSLSSPDTMLDNVERARPPYRAPIVYPILYGHILTHVVAAICATCGRERIRDESGNSLLGGYDSFEENSSTKMSSPDKKRANNATSADEQQLDSDGDIPLLHDCENFIKIGMIARVLQVLLGKMDFGKEEEKDIQAIDILGAWFGGSIQCDVPLDEEKNEDWSGYNWKKGCFLLMEAAISPLAACRKQPAKTFIDQLIPSEQLDIIEKFVLACDVAQNESLSLLSDAALILQILIPGVVKLKENIQQQESPKSREDSLKHITSWLRIEPLVSILMGPKGALVRGMIAKWYLDAYPIDFTANGNKTDLRNPLNKRLDCKREFRIVDWPLPLSSTVESPSTAQNDKPAVSLKSEGILSQISEATLKSPLPTSTSQLPNNNVISPFASSSRGSPSTSRISGKKCVQLLRGYYHQIENQQNHNSGTNVASSLSITSTPPSSASASASASLFPSSLFKRPVTMYPHRPRIKELPTSYTDLYAELGVLCPDTDQKTALCLVCGEILNAGGKGECTKHALRCGGGSGIFFLLQECRGLIVHGGKAAYVHSPYVDSHGETPQYRGRPLNLDLVRYNNLRDLWVGHLVRERVIAERGGSRQVIIPNFY